MRPTFLGGLIATAMSLALVIAAPANARLDYSGPAFNILAPGEFGGLPANQYSTDQGQLYNALTPLEGHVTMADVARDYLSEKFGVQGPVVRVERPKPGLTIDRDQHDVPHIYGRTRADVMFGSGWAAAEDRGLLLLEGLGPAYLATLDVPGINPFSLVTSFRSFTPSQQTINFVARQENVLRRAGWQGRQVLRDLQDWVDGINAYEASSEQAGPKLPKAKLTDAIAGFAFIGSIFGNGGGNEVANSDFLARLEQRLGPKAGLKVFRDLREVNDPEAPTTIKKPFPYDGVPKGPTPGAMVIDPGSETSAETTAMAAQEASHKLASNFIIAGHKYSANHHPIAVMGPQLGYYYPEIVMQGDLHGGGINAEGIIAPIAPYVFIGRGRDFAWSLTSARLRERAAVPREAVQPGREPSDPRLALLLLQGPLPSDEVLRRRSAGGGRRPARARAHVLRDRPRSRQRHRHRARPSLCGHARPFDPRRRAQRRDCAE